MNVQSDHATASVLIVDDSRAMRRIIRSALESAGLFHHYFEAADGEEALRIAASELPDMILCDLDMPVLDGFGFLRRFRAVPSNRGAFVLMLSGSGDTEKKVEGFALGANDYIVKPCHPAEVCARVSNYLKLKHLQSQLEEKNGELQRKNRELAVLATTDSMTGAYNRRYFVSHVEGEIARSRQHGASGSIFILDVDHFKRVNDTLGHALGDAVLIGVANVVRSTVRATDVFARFGGEEFVVWSPCAQVGGGADLAERIRVAVAAMTLPGLPWSVTVSIGLADMNPRVQESLDTIIKRADTALYEAKRGGRNRVIDSAALGAAVPSAPPPPPSPSPSPPLSPARAPSLHPKDDASVAFALFG